MSKLYKINKLKGILNISDKDDTDFHIKKNDYFGTLATILELIQEDNILKDSKKIKTILSDIKNDLIYLQENFIIKKKTKKFIFDQKNQKSKKLKKE